MMRTEPALVAALARGDFEPVLAAPEDVDWGRVGDLARHHRVAGLAWSLWQAAAARPQGDLPQEVARTEAVDDPLGLRSRANLDLAAEDHEEAVALVPFAEEGGPLAVTDLFEQARHRVQLGRVEIAEERNPLEQTPAFGLGGGFHRRTESRGYPRIGKRRREARSSSMYCMLVLTSLRTLLTKSRFLASFGSLGRWMGLPTLKTIFEGSGR